MTHQSGKGHLLDRALDTVCGVQILSSSSDVLVKVTLTSHQRRCRWQASLCSHLTVDLFGFSACFTENNKMFFMTPRWDMKLSEQKNKTG